MEQLRLRINKFFPVYVLFTLVLMACKPQGESPVVPEDKELVQACAYIHGGGSAATGGEGGTLCVVDRLDDVIDRETGRAEEGTLRRAIEQGGARVVVFRVSGTIHLNSPLELSRGNITIAGQTAPGDGICIADYPLIIKDCENVIVRFLRVRLGDTSGKEYDAISVNNTKNVVLDHVSCSWSTDECVSCYGNENFTLQYSIISESLTQSVHLKGAHGYGGIWGGKNVSFHHNLLAHHSSRNPRFDHDYVNTMAGPIDYINNVVYNWGGNSTYGGEGSSNGGGGRKVNFINNYYKPGPATKNKARLLNPWASCSNCSDHFGGTIVPPLVYLTGNYMQGSSVVTADNWKGVDYSEGATEAMCRVNTRYTFDKAFVSEESAEAAYETVLSKGGCSFRRDALDEVMISDVRKGSYTHKGSNGSTNGLIDSQKDAGGWPELKSEAPAKDTDRDGMPDAWETAHGLNPLSPTDAREHTLVAAHTNLECYLCDIVKHLY